MENKEFLRACARYLMDFGYEQTSFMKGIYMFLVPKTYEVVRIQIIDGSVIYNKTHEIKCISDLVELISPDSRFEYQKFPILNSSINKISEDYTYLKDQNNLNRFLNEISNSLIESRLNGIEESKAKHKIKKSIC